MFTLQVPDRGFCVGQHLNLKISGKLQHLYWRDARTLLLDDQLCYIALIVSQDGIMTFSLCRYQQPARPTRPALSSRSAP